MPLPMKENIKKSNKPLFESLEYYKQAGIGDGFYIYDETKELLDEYSDINGVPSESFFMKRKEMLRGYFELAVNY